MSRYESYAQPTRTLGFGGRITWAVQRLILLNGAIFAAWLLYRPFGAVVAEGLGFDPIGALMFQPGDFTSGALWQPATYFFLHGGLWHLTINMLTLYFFGPEVERELGTPQFFRMYVFCGVVSVLATFVPYAIYGRDANVIGASGAVMGVLTAFVVLDPQRQVFLFPLPFPITALGMMIFIVFINILASVDGSDVSVETHFGGMAAGYCYMKFATRIERAWRRRRFRVVPKPAAPQKPATPADWDKVGKVVNDILKDKERDFMDRGGQ